MCMRREGQKRVEIRDGSMKILHLVGSVRKGKITTDGNGGEESGLLTEDDVNKDQVVNETKWVESG